MKFSADKNKLSDAITNAAKAASGRSSIAALEGVLLHLEGNMLTVTGYDLEMGIKSIIEVNGYENGEIVLIPKVFGEMVRKMPSNVPVELETSNDTKVIFRSGEIVFNLIGISGNDYPNITELNNSISFVLKENVLRSMLWQTSYAVPNIEINSKVSIPMGCIFEIRDNVLNVVGVDGFRVAKRIETINYNDMEFVVPIKTVNELERVLGDNDKDITITVDKNQISFTKDDYMILSRLLEGKYVDYNKIMNYTPEQEAKVNVREYMNALERTMLLITEKYKSPVVCTFDNDNLNVSCKTGLGEYKENIKIDYTGKHLEIAFNAKLMIDALRFSECDEIKIQLVGELSPIKLVPIGDESFIFIFLPVRRQ